MVFVVPNDVGVLRRLLFRERVRVEKAGEVVVLVVVLETVALALLRIHLHIISGLLKALGLDELGEAGVVFEAGVDIVSPLPARSDRRLPLAYVDEAGRLARLDDYRERE